MSALEESMLAQIREAKLPEPEREVRFSYRRFRFDFAWSEPKIALEVEGGVWVSGRHGSGKGMDSDATKYNIAALLGWKVIRVTTNMVRDGRAIEFVKQALEATP